MTTTIPAEITAFASRVRAALADLPADELEELTEGLEADLAEAYAEDLARELPDAEAYAAELRTAAGLPEPAAGRRTLRERAGSLRQGARETVRDLEVVVRRHRAGRAVLDLAASVAPIWWVVRAWVAWRLATEFFGADAGFAPRTGLWWLVLGAAVLVSVQWGRREWGAARIRPLLVLGNVVAVVALAPVVAHAVDWEEITYSSAYLADPYVEGADLTGLYLDGNQVTNVFAYDAKGRPLRDVQLFTSDGTPLRTSVVGGSGCTDAACTSTSFWSPAVLDGGRVAWNVFPLRMLEADAEVTGIEPGARPRALPLPFRSAPTVDRVASSRTSALASVFEAAGYQVPSAMAEATAGTGR
jgi:hypothetical protein